MGLLAYPTSIAAAREARRLAAWQVIVGIAV